MGIKKRVLKLSTTHFCDVSNKVRLIDQKIHQISKQKIFGYAFTVNSNGNIDVVVEALELSKPNDVVVISSNNNKDALAGEIFATIAKRNKLAGIIIDGACRDVDGIKKVGLPFYAKTVNPKVSSGKKRGLLQSKITCGGVLIKSRDIIFGDENGIIVMTEKDFIKTLPLAEAKLEKENLWLKRINMNYKVKDVFK